MKNIFRWEKVSKDQEPKESKESLKIQERHREETENSPPRPHIEQTREHERMAWNIE